MNSNPVRRTLRWLVALMLAIDAIVMYRAGPPLGEGLRSMLAMMREALSR
jgi:hypothetical protein